MEISASDLSAIISAIATVAGLLGTGIVALWRRIEKINRQTKIELEKCKQRERISRERRTMLITALEFVLHALYRHDPTAPEIDQSRKMIEDLRVRDQLEEALMKDDD